MHNNLEDLLSITAADREYASAAHLRWCCGRIAPVGFEDGRDAVRPCRYDRCTEERCECGAYMGGWGPAGCHCQG
jgi:hypothetical protein